MKKTKILKLLVVNVVALLLFACQGGSGNSNDRGTGGVNGTVHVLNKSYKKNLNFELDLPNSQTPTLTEYNLRFEKGLVTDKPIALFPNGTKDNPILPRIKSKSHTLELNYINRGDQPIKIKKIKFDIPKEYVLIEKSGNGCYQIETLRQEIPAGGKCSIMLQGNLLDFKLPPEGVHKFSFEIPKFDIDILDERGNVIDEYIDIQPQRRFGNADDDTRIWVQAEYLVVKVDTSIYKHPNQKYVMQAFIDYKGLLSDLYKDHLVKVSFLKLSDDFKVLNDGGCRQENVTEKYINFTCQIVQQFMTYEANMFPRHIIEITFNNVRDDLYNASFSLQMKKFLVNLIYNNNDNKKIIIKKNETDTKNFELKDYSINEIAKFTKVDFGDIYISNGETVKYNATTEEVRVIEHLNSDKAKCIGFQSCDVTFPNGTFDSDVTLNLTQIRQKYVNEHSMKMFIVSLMIDYKNVVITWDCLDKGSNKRFEKKVGTIRRFLLNGNVKFDCDVKNI